MKKVIYFISEDWVFLNHRLELAKKIQNKGYEITLIVDNYIIPESEILFQDAIGMFTWRPGPNKSFEYNQ